MLLLAIGFYRSDFQVFGRMHKSGKYAQVSFGRYLEWGNLTKKTQKAEKAESRFLDEKGVKK